MMWITGSGIYITLHSLYWQVKDLMQKGALDVRYGDISKFNRATLKEKKKKKRFQLGFRWLLNPPIPH